MATQQLANLNGYSLFAAPSHQVVDTAADRAVRTATRRAKQDARRSSIPGAFAVKTVLLANTVNLLAKGFATSDASVNYEGFAQVRNNLARAAEGRPIDGSALTGIYQDLAASEEVLRSQPLTDKILSKSAPETKLAKEFAGLDFNDPNDVAKFMRASQKYIKSCNLTEAAGFTLNSATDSEIELAILLNLNSSANFASHLTDIENVINKQLAETVKGYEEQLEPVAQSLKSSGVIRSSKLNTKNLEIIKSRNQTAPFLSADQSKALDALLRFHANEANGVNTMLLGRVATGEIDVDSVIQSGQFCGVEIDDDVKTLLRGIKALANTDNIFVSEQNAILEQLGKNSQVVKMDMNDLGMLDHRIKEFSDAIETYGFVAPIGKSFSAMSVKELRYMLDNNMITDDKVVKGVKELIKLKEQRNLVVSKKNVRAMLRGSALMLLARANKDNGFGAGLSALMAGYNIVRSAVKIIVKAGKTILPKLSFFNRLPVSVQNRILYSRSTMRMFGSQTANSATSAVASSNAQNAISRFVSNATSQLANKLLPAETTQKIAAKRRENAAKKAQKKLTEKAGKQTKLQKTAKYLEKSGGRHSLETARSMSRLKATASAAKGGTAAASAAGGTAASAAGGTAAGAAAGAAASAPPVLIIAAIVIAVIIIIEMYSVALTLLSRSALDFYVTISEPLRTVVNDVETFFINLFAGEVPTQNTLFKETIIALQKTEKNNKDIVYLLELLNDQDKGYYSFVDPTTGEMHRFPIDASEIDKTRVFYTFRDENGNPVTQYDVIKLVMSMANTVVPEINTTQNAEDFTDYAVGLWHHLNSSELLANIYCCDEGDVEYLYYCNNMYDPLYNSYITYGKPDTLIPIEPYSSTEDTVLMPGGGNIMVLGEEPIQPYDAKGCQVKYYDENGDFVTYLRKDHSIVATGGGSTTTLMRILSSAGTSLARKYASESADDEGVSNPFVRMMGNTYYLVDPIIASGCKDDVVKQFDGADIHALRMAVATLNFHGKSDMSDCTNYEHFYCEEDCQSSTFYHGSTLIGTEDVYEHITEYANGACCENAVEVIIEGVTYWQCMGETATWCPGHYACLGHYTCPGHNECPGHDCSICTGHIAYNLNVTTASTDNDDYLFADWEYTSDGKFLFWTTHTTYTSEQICSREEFEGWNVDTKFLARETAIQDWYRKYQIGSADFIGGRVSESEANAIMEVFDEKGKNITDTRRKIVETALKAVGVASYYPGGIASQPGIDAPIFGMPAEVKLGIENTYYGTTGLDGAYLADYIVWTALGNRASSLTSLETMAMSQTAARSKSVLPGDVIIKPVDKGNWTTGIIINRIDDENALIVTFQDGWASLVTTSLGGWKKVNAGIS